MATRILAVFENQIDFVKRERADVIRLKSLTLYKKIGDKELVTKDNTKANIHETYWLDFLNKNSLLFTQKPFPTWISRFLRS